MPQSIHHLELWKETNTANKSRLTLQQETLLLGHKSLQAVISAYEGNIGGKKKKKEKEIKKPQNTSIPTA